MKSLQITLMLCVFAFILCVSNESYLLLRSLSDSQNFFQTGTLGIVLCHRLLELHIVFVLINSAIKK